MKPTTRRRTAPRHDGPLTHTKNKFLCTETRAQQNLIIDVDKEEYKSLFDRYRAEFRAGRSELSKGAQNGLNSHSHKRALFDYIALWIGQDGFEFKSLIHVQHLYTPQ